MAKKKESKTATTATLEAQAQLLMKKHSKEECFECGGHLYFSKRNALAQAGGDEDLITTHEYAVEAVEKEPVKKEPVE
jgi:hypothetical protein